MKQEPDDKSSIPIKQEDEERQQSIVTEENMKVIGSIELIKKEEIDVNKPVVGDPPLEDPEPVDEHLAADPDPIPDVIEEDPVDPSGGNGDMEQTGEPAGVPGTEAENQLPGVLSGEPAPPPVVEETQTKSLIPSGEVEIDNTDWPVSKDQIEGILIVAMAEPNYMDYTIDDLLTKIRKSTGSSFHPFRSQIAVLAARAKITE